MFLLELMFDYFILILIFVTYSLQYNAFPDAIVDPILCDELQLQTEWTDLQLELLDMCEEKEDLKVRNVRDADSNITYSNKSRLTSHQQEMIIDLHNNYRRLVIPLAANMKMMKWDDNLAAIAQKWADKCEFHHGRPDDVDDIDMGQNLYVGHDATGMRGIDLWFGEKEYYDFREDECIPGEQCGHYIQLVWANTEYVGCAISKCVKHGYLFACHYKPRGNYPDVSPYLVGVPCSLCQNGFDGGLCYRKLCVTSKDCQNYNINCTCDLHCHNCGKLNPNQCRCYCKPGWDSLDCSTTCMDLHEFCGEDPGWPNAMSCSKENHRVRDEHCRKMCKQCKEVAEDDLSMKKENMCCGGRVCEDGMTLNDKCQCQLLCPGPICYGQKEVGNTYDDHDEEYDIESVRAVANRIHINYFKLLIFYLLIY